MKKLIIFLITITAIIIIDQWSKIYISSNYMLGESRTIIDGFFNFTYVQNKGAAFGFGNSFDTWVRVALFKVLPVGAIGWLFVLLFKSLKGTLIMSWAYTFIIGGAIGNIIDRIRLDYVVDFFDFYYGTKHFATFNVADSAISLAAGLIILDFFINKENKEESVSSIEAKKQT